MPQTKEEFLAAWWGESITESVRKDIEEGHATKITIEIKLTEN